MAYLAGSLVGIERHPMLAEAPFGRRINGIADFFGGYGRRCHPVPAVKPPGFHQGLENKFRHRAAANIAVADKQDAYRTLIHLIQGELFDLLQGSGQLVRATGAATFAVNAFQTGNDVVLFHSGHEGAQALRIAVAAAGVADAAKGISL